MKTIVERKGNWESSDGTKWTMIWKRKQKGKGVERPGSGSTFYSIVQCRTFLKTRGRRPFSEVSLHVLWVYHLYQSTL